MNQIIYIGCRTTRERNARGKGLKVCQLQEDGSLKEIQLIEHLENPSYQCMDREGKFLYTVHGDNHEISAFRIQEDGTLTLINQVGGIGRNPVFITVDNTNKFLYIASLQGGCINVVRRQEDGSVEPPFFYAKLPGRTEKGISHAHQCLWDRTGKYLFVPAQGRKIGYGSVHVFRKMENGTLEETDCFYAEEKDEPRHGVIHPNNRFFYFVNERGNSVTFCLFDEETGKLEYKETISALPKGYTGEGQASALVIHPSGRFLYESNRIHDSITVFTINQDTGQLRFSDNISCQGKTPRFMTLDPEGGTLCVENEDSDNIRFFQVDEKTGKLTDTGRRFDTESPVCLLYAEKKEENK